MVIKVIPDVTNRKSQPSFGVKFYKPKSTLKKAAGWLVWNGDLEESKVAVSKIAALSRRKDNINVRFDDDKTLHTFIIKKDNKDSKEYRVLAPMGQTLSRNLNDTADLLTDIKELQNKFANGFSFPKDEYLYNFMLCTPKTKLKPTNNIKRKVHQSVLFIERQAKAIKNGFVFLTAKTQNIGEYKVRYKKNSEFPYSPDIYVKYKDNPLTKRYMMVTALGSTKDVQEYLHGYELQRDIRNSITAKKEVIQKKKEEKELIQHIEKAFSKK